MLKCVLSWEVLMKRSLGRRRSRLRCCYRRRGLAPAVPRVIDKLQSSFSKIDLVVIFCKHHTLLDLVLFSTVEKGDLIHNHMCSREEICIISSKHTVKLTALLDCVFTWIGVINLATVQGALPAEVLSQEEGMPFMQRHQCSKYLGKHCALVRSLKTIK